MVQDAAYGGGELIGGNGWERDGAVFGNIDLTQRTVDVVGGDGGMRGGVVKVHLE